MSWTGERPFRVARKDTECEGVASLWLEPIRGGAPPEFEPGQFLTLVVDVAGERRPLVRCYSLSDAPNGRSYRITVKKVPAPPGKVVRPGRASSELVDNVQVGDILPVRAPAGHFTLTPGEEDPVVLVGGGIGVTPLLGMLEGLVARGEERKVWFVLGVRSQREHPFKARLEELAANHSWLQLHVAYSRPGPDDREGRDFHRRGRVRPQLLEELLPPTDRPYAFYVCGPAKLMEDVTAGLEARGVPRSRVHVEAFGSAAIRPFTRRLKQRLGPQGELSGGLTVTFTASGKTVPWDPGASSLLDLAMANDVFFPFACAAGHCGTCHMRLREGEVAYPVEPQFAIREGYCLPCIAVPKTDVSLDT